MNKNKNENVNENALRILEFIYSQQFQIPFFPLTNSHVRIYLH